MQVPGDAPEVRRFLQQRIVVEDGTAGGGHLGDGREARAADLVEHRRSRHDRFVLERNGRQRD